MPKLTSDQQQSIVAAAIKDAVDYIESDIAPRRVKSQRYFNGESDVAHEPERSKVVATKCRDVVRAVKPALMRTFLQTDKAVEFIPRGPEDVAQAEQATDYLTWRFWETDGYRVFSDVTQDALVKMAGFVKVSWEESERMETVEYDGLTMDQFLLLAEDGDPDEAEQDEATGLISATFTRTETDGRLHFQSIPPEEFFIDENARSLDDFWICGHRTEMRAGDLVAMGFDLDEVKDLGTESLSDEEETERLRNATAPETGLSDESMRPVLVTEAYMKMDMEGNGKPRLYKFLCGGTGYKILDSEPVDDVPFAVFEIDPEPHAFFGRSLVEIVEDDQDAATSMLRGAIDNVKMTNNPAVVINDAMTDPDDWLNSEIGAIRRSQGDPRASFVEQIVPFTAGNTLPFMAYFDGTVERKTGVTGAGTGMDPDALQSTTAAGVNAAVQASTAQAEVMARNLAEGGMRRLFSLMLKLFVRHQPRETVMRLRGEFVEVDPTQWNPSLDLAVNVGLGHNRHEERAMVLRETLQWQMQIWSSYGPQNGMVTLSGIRNTLADIQRHGGIYSTERYFEPMDPQREAQLLAAAQQAAQSQQGGDPNAAFMQVEAMKAQMRAQTDQQRLALEAEKAQAEEARKRQELLMDDDRARDKMAQDLGIAIAEALGKYGVQIDKNQIAREQAAQRYR